LVLRDEDGQGTALAREHRDRIVVGEDVRAPVWFYLGRAPTSTKVT
jgi:hypothetical protein